MILRKIIKLALKAIVFILLTVITQIGGLVFLVSLYLNNIRIRNKRIPRLIVFFLLYLASTYVLVPTVAPFFGRERIVTSEWINPTFFATNFCNRNYVKPKLNEVLRNASEILKRQRIEISYLDANFPFIDRFPLLPHLSHNDGKKIDVSLIYQLESGKISNRKRSVSGYGVFVRPKKDEFNQTKICKEKGYFQYDYPKYLKLARINKDLQYSNHYTELLIKAFLDQDAIKKVFIEPHLKNRFKINDSRLRFHGCRAVRHDDHIHFEI